jgi:cyclase
MRRIRVIPTLLIKNAGLVKSVKFQNHKYVGDPINAVRIFNDKGVDEIVILNISATPNNEPPNFDTIRGIVSEAFMPVGYGGGITDISQIRDLVTAGVEKVILNTAVHKNSTLVSEGARYVGSQSIVVSIDVKKNWLGRYKVYTNCGRSDTGLDPIAFATKVEREGAGEIILNSIDRDGTFSGYDCALIKAVSEAVSIPVVAVGGAGSVDDFRLAVQSGASAVAAGSFFVFQLPHRAVLISYPQEEELKERLFLRLQ